MKKSSALLGILVLSPLLFFVAPFLWLISGDNPRPDEATLIQRFHDQQTAYERLRDMLLAEKAVRLVATWGVHTADSPLSLKPPIADFPSARYDEYLSLLKQVGGRVVSRSRDDAPEVCIYVWSAGFAGETRHEALCWRDSAPPRQVASIDKIDDVPIPAGERHSFFYKPVEGNWYVLRDE